MAAAAVGFQTRSLESRPAAAMATPHVGKISTSRLSSNSGWDNAASNPMNRVLSGEVCVDYLSRLMFRQELQAALVGQQTATDDGSSSSSSPWLFFFWSWFACYGATLLLALVLCCFIAAGIRSVAWYERERRWRKEQQRQAENAAPDHKRKKSQ
jgi:hypothetical protein